MSATGKASAGFTLMETLVALAIMALVSGIAFPALHGRAARGRLDAARTDITLALAQARADAIGRAVPTRLALAPDGTLQSSSGRPPVTLPNGVGVVWPERGFTFYPDGTAVGGEGEIVTDRVRTRFVAEPGTGSVVFPS